MAGDAPVTGATPYTFSLAVMQRLRALPEFQGQSMIWLGFAYGAAYAFARFQASTLPGGSPEEFAQNALALIQHQIVAGNELIPSHYFSQAHGATPVLHNALAAAFEMATRPPRRRKSREEMPR